MMRITMEFEKETKNTVRFQEKKENPEDEAKLGTLYVPKKTLQKIIYKSGDNLYVELTTV